MRKVIWGFLTTALAFLPSTATKAGNANMKAASVESKRALCSSINAFTFDFFAAIKGSEPGNVFLSPYSIAAALFMTNAGARGNTRQELHRALHTDKLPSEEAIHATMGALISDFNAQTRDGKPRGFRLAVANRLFGAKGAQFLPDFLAVNANQYGAPLEQMDFLNETEASRKAINKWVLDKTNNKVPELIGQGQLTKSAKLVLVNAIYFNADWSAPFEKSETAKAPFTVADGHKVDAPLMHKNSRFGYYEEPGKLQAIELPYSGRELSMLVLLPAPGEKLAALESRLSADTVAKWNAAMTSQTVDLYLPKFKMTWGTKNVVPQLESLGIKDAFVFPKADFSGMDGQKTLIISLVLHKAFVDVNEEGTEAAAATAVIAAPGGAPPPPSKPKLFRADHPFLFLIRDNTSGTILFIGRVANPTEPT